MTNDCLRERGLGREGEQRKREGETIDTGFSEVRLDQEC